MKRTNGASRNLTYRYNQLISEEMDKRKFSQNDSRGEFLEKMNNSKYDNSLFIIL
jgi:hypothetical protein